jgi:hypothetical protein
VLNLDTDPFLDPYTVFDDQKNNITVEKDLIGINSHFSEKNAKYFYRDRYKGFPKSRKNLNLSIILFCTPFPS